MSPFNLGLVILSSVLVVVSSDANKTAEAPAVESPATPDAAKNGTEIADDKENEVEDVPDETWVFENKTKVDTRRILYGKNSVNSQRPYMVYLQLPKKSAKLPDYKNWLCGGVIIHKCYVLTSAACVEDAEHLYVVSGTNKFLDGVDYQNDDCICKHRRKAVWKCVPKNYKFEFDDSTKWSSNDIAILKVDKPFNIGSVDKGCQFATEVIAYNNVSRELEQTGTKGTICGWGSMGGFREGIDMKTRRRHREETKVDNAKCLQEAKVCVMDNDKCAKRWAQRYRPIINEYMICTKDVAKRLSEICEKKYANCTDMEELRRANYEKLDQTLTKSTDIDLGRHAHNESSRRTATSYGGFCQNDHGGPLIVKYKSIERVIGVISACKIDPKTRSCYGPFLYTSVFKNRQFISCSVNKDVEEGCRRVFRAGITHDEWEVDWSRADEEEEGARQDKDEEEKPKEKEEEKVKEKEKEKGSETKHDE